MTVVDISQQLPGPYASALLMQLGAHVIKIEPLRGDPSRTLDRDMYDLVNAGKDIHNIDLKAPAGVVRLHEFVRSADVLIEGFRPGVAARLGAGWPELARLRPRLVYCSVSGTGQSGPYAQTPVHDLNLQAMAGIDPGPGIGVPWVDLGTATTAALSIVAAWHEAGVTGAGMYLDAAMLDTAVTWNRVKASAHGQPQPTYGIFPTADGYEVAIAILEDHIWQRLCVALGWDDWAGNREFAHYADRIAAAPQIQERLVESVSRMGVDDLTRLAQLYDLPLTPAGDKPAATVMTQLEARGMDQDGRRFPLPLSPRTSDRDF
ncbi:CaiB/BaiF CoA transferase family protein [Antricoccus suffuscus]|nr:CaiB/BaiF CoA-transferase family protein [Antricoccus suffuscus]